MQVRAGGVEDKLSQVSSPPVLLEESLMYILAAKTADLIVIMLDATKSDDQRRLLEYELDVVGIRLNKTKPDVVFKKKTTGGVRELSKNVPIRVSLTICPIVLQITVSPFFFVRSARY